MLESRFVKRIISLQGCSDKRSRFFSYWLTDRRSTNFINKTSLWYMTSIINLLFKIERDIYADIRERQFWHTEVVSHHPPGHSSLYETKFFEDNKYIFIDEFFSFLKFFKICQSHEGRHHLANESRESDDSSCTKPPKDDSDDNQSYQFVRSSCFLSVFFSIDQSLMNSRHERILSKTFS